MSNPYAVPLVIFFKSSNALVAFSALPVICVIVRLNASIVSCLPMALEIELLTKLALALKALKTPMPLAIFIIELVAPSLALLMPERLLLAIFIVLVKF